MEKMIRNFFLSLLAITGVVSGAQSFHNEHSMRLVAEHQRVTAEEQARRGAIEQQQVSRAAYRKALMDIKRQQAEEDRNKRLAAQRKEEAKKKKQAHEAHLRELEAERQAKLERKRLERLERERLAEAKRQEELTRQREAAKVQQSTPTYTPKPSPTPSPKKDKPRTYDPPAQTSGGGSPKAYARAQLSSDQFNCLDLLWNKESGWNVYATNPSSGAYGIPQSLPGSKMASAGSDWQTNGVTQVIWGLGYIRSVYGTPCSAWAHSQAVNWY